MKKSKTTQLKNYKVILGELRNKFGEIKCYRDLTINRRWIEVEVYKSETQLEIIENYIKDNYNHLVELVRIGNFRSPNPHKRLMFKIVVE
jgi:hypothetical protein